MSGMDVAVLAGAVAVALWVNWYFFLAGRGNARAATGNAGIQEMTIAVRGGYDPGAVKVKAGVPVRLVFDRQETSSCSEEIVLPDFGIRRYLPAHEKTPVEFTPTEPGTYEITCGMGMMHGKLIVEEAAK